MHKKQTTTIKSLNKGIFTVKTALFIIITSQLGAHGIQKTTCKVYEEEKIVRSKQVQTIIHSSISLPHSSTFNHYFSIFML